jgi:hypothetical protein
MPMQLLQALNCVDKDLARDLSLSRPTCASHGLALCDYFKGKTIKMMENVASVSIMFDEPSDIQMHKHLNVFVNVRYCWSCAVRGVFLLLSLLLSYTMHVCVGATRRHGGRQNVDAHFGRSLSTVCT